MGACSMHEKDEKYKIFVITPEEKETTGMRDVNGKTILK
jgi:hypothetical protein